jgi:FeS assembly SUF system regulator
LTGYLATHEEEPASARILAEATGIPVPTVVKLLKIMMAGGILQSIQGRNGGYRLGRAPCDVSVAEVIESVDGPIALTECTRGDGDCRIEDHCQVRRHWRLINGALRRSLADISLADLGGRDLHVRTVAHPYASDTRRQPLRHRITEV